MGSQKEKELKSRFGLCTTRTYPGETISYVLYWKGNSYRINGFYVSKENFEGLGESGSGICYGQSCLFDVWFRLFVLEYQIIEIQRVPFPKKAIECDPREILKNGRKKSLCSRYVFNSRSSLGPAMPYVLYKKGDVNQMFPYHISKESFDGLIDHGCGKCYGRSPWNKNWLRFSVFKYVIIGIETVTDSEKIEELDNWLANYNDEE